MLRYTNMFLIRAFAALIIFSFSFNKCLNAKTILATYDISWNNILLGNIFWEFSVLPQSYNFSIKLESSGLSSKLYPFYGIYSSSGIKTAEGFFSPEKYNHVWRGKKWKGKFTCWLQRCLLTISNAVAIDPMVQLGW